MPKRSRAARATNMDPKSQKPERAPERKRRCRAKKQASDSDAPRPTSLQDLPCDVLRDIFCRFTSEGTLLGAVAKVNREFREIALEPLTRQSVQKNFIKDHAGQCSSCSYLSSRGSVNFGDFERCVVNRHAFACVRFIVLTTKGAMLQKTDCHGSTVFHRAAWKGRIEVLRYLHQEGGDEELLYAKNKYGTTVLHCGVYFGRVRVVRFLLEEAGAFELLEEENKDGETPMDLALRRRKFKVLKYMRVDDGGDGGDDGDDVDESTSDKAPV
eukprot:Rmarinus@m.29715